MLSKLRPHLSYANVVSTVCLFVLLGGTAVAAIKITGKNVQNSSLTGVDVKNNSLTGKDVKNKSLTPRDFKGSVQGPKGDTGSKGDQGPPGTARAYAHVNADGTLDAARSKNVLDVRPACNGLCTAPPPPAADAWQCFRLGFSPNSAVATYEANSAPGPQKAVSVNIPGPPAIMFARGCAPGYEDAWTIMVDLDTATINTGGFFIVFN